jgi:hypothetical protein
VVANAAPGTVGVSATTVTASGLPVVTRTATTTATTTVSLPPGSVPVNLTPPDVTFPTFTQAQVVPGTWDLQGATLLYQWQDCSTATLGCVDAGSGTTLDLTGLAIQRIRVLEVAANDACPQSCIAASPERDTPSLR